MNMSFDQSSEAEPHIKRRQEILKKHPEVKKLIGKDSRSAFFIVLIVASQIAIASQLSQWHWTITLLMVYVFGAFANHALYTLIHEGVHGLIFKGRALNLMAAIIANIGSVVPSALSFQAFHLQHHTHQGVLPRDADLPRKWEARLFNFGALGKFIWIFLYSILVSLRSFDMKAVKLNTKWTVINYIIVFSTDALIVYFFGWEALLYLLASTLIGLGFHPAGARWIQEHFLMNPEQETYSYYGALNKVSFNVGYHNEHHDFPNIPWSGLPKLKELAPEYYDNLASHQSWTKLMFMFIFNPNITLLSRIERECRFGLKKSA